MILKETIAYYVRNQSSVFCTFLDASKAFDRVHYSKLFRLLFKRKLPSVIIRGIVNLYMGDTGPQWSLSIFRQIGVEQGK
jgi:hypothetical protein